MATYKHSYAPNLYFFYGNDEEFRNVIVKIWYRNKKDTYLFDSSFPRNVQGSIPSDIKIIKSIPTGKRMWGLDRNSMCFINFLPRKQFINRVLKNLYPRCISIYRIDISTFIFLLKKNFIEVQTSKLKFLENYL